MSDLDSWNKSASVAGCLKDNVELTRELLTETVEDYLKKNVRRLW